jgi:uncharacterized protein (TIGR03382 family)
MSISRDDLEAKLREIGTAVDETKQQAQTAGVMIAAGAVVVIGLVYLLGRRRGGKAKGARIEVFRL